MSVADVRTVFDALYGAYGPQHWWPATTDFEVMAGAVLTQNTAWRNVERALANLRAAGALEPAALMALEPSRLAEQIRPAGYYNIKAARLRNLTAALLDDGGVEGWRSWPTPALRQRLLDINGVGAETADSILLYVYHRPVFVVDAYTRRIFTRLELLRGSETYRQVAAVFEDALPEDTALFNEYHALIVRLGSERCRPRPRCSLCPVRAMCPTGQIRADESAEW